MSSAKTQRGMNSRPDIFIFLGPRQTSSRSKMKPALVMTHISITGSRITMLGLFLALDSQPALCYGSDHIVYLQQNIFVWKCIRWGKNYPQYHIRRIYFWGKLFFKTKFDKIRAMFMIPIWNQTFVKSQTRKVATFVEEINF